MSAQSEPSLCRVNLIPRIGLYGGATQPVLTSYLSIIWSGRETSLGGHHYLCKEGRGYKTFASYHHGDRKIQPVSRKVKA